MYFLLCIVGPRRRWLFLVVLGWLFLVVDVSCCCSLRLELWLFVAACCRWVCGYVDCVAVCCGVYCC